MTGVQVQTPDAASINEAADRLRAGQVVVIPTETVYGLGASTLDAGALAKVFILKQRPEDNPLIAHVLDGEHAATLVSDWDERCRRLAEAFWPGPLTMILQRRPEVPDIASGGRNTLAVRSPSHPVARAVLTAFGGPISAPSANRSNRISPTLAAHVADDYLGVEEANDLLVLDGGGCDFGIESTVLDMTSPVPTILRPGSITLAAIADVIGQVDRAHSEKQTNSPGTTSRHYAPRTPMCLMDRDAIEAELRSTTESCVVLLFGSTLDGVDQPVIHTLPDDPIRCGEALYSTLRELDKGQHDRILVERPPVGPGWDAVRDRIQRASVDVSTTRSAGGGSSGGSS
jgi:L-threonylcarbamoyladenylate synthase